jgi:hypothetical protein
MLQTQRTLVTSQYLLMYPRQALQRAIRPATSKCLRVSELYLEDAEKPHGADNVKSTCKALDETGTYTTHFE